MPILDVIARLLHPNQRKMDSEGVLGMWNRLSGSSSGKKVFSRLIGASVPYTGRLGAVVEELAPGKSQIRLDDRRAVRNHLQSVHAMALANLGEFTTGLAVMTALPADARAILTKFSIEYLKKARGTLRGHSVVAPIASSQEQELEVKGDIKDASGEVVARAHAQWRIGPKKK